MYQSPVLFCATGPHCHPPPTPLPPPHRSMATELRASELRLRDAQGEAARHGEDAQVGVGCGYKRADAVS